MPTRRATEAAYRNLTKDRINPITGGNHGPVHTHLDRTHPGRFETDARMWLRNYSNFSTHGLDRIDYRALFDTFREYAELPPYTEPAAAPSPDAVAEDSVAIPGLGPIALTTLDYLKNGPAGAGKPDPAPKVHMMRDGFPEGRYTVTLPDEREVTFWFKFHRKGAKALTEEVLQRDPTGSGKSAKWRSLRDLRDYKQALEIIKSDPYTQAIAFGLRFGACSVCGRPITRPQWLKLGIGYRCAEDAHPGRVDLDALFGGQVPETIDADH